MTNDTNTLGFIFPEWDRKFLAGANELRNNALKNAIIHGKQNIPTMTEKSNAPYFGVIKSGYEVFHSALFGEMKPEVHAAKFKRCMETTRKRLEEIEREIEALRHANLVDERNLDGKVKPQPIKLNPITIILLLCMYLGETYYNGLAFEFYGGSKIGAYLIGACITIVEAMIAFTIGKNLNRLEAKGKKIDFKTGALCFVLLTIISSMTVLRSHAIADLDSTMPAWVFFFINAGLIIGTVIASRHFFPTQKEKDEVIALRKQFEKIEEREKQIGKLADEKIKVGETLGKEQAQYQLVISQAQRTTEHTHAHYRETIEQYKAENLITRSDKGMPACFLAPVPELNLITFNPDNL